MDGLQTHKMITVGYNKTAHMQIVRCSKIYEQPLDISQSKAWLLEMAPLIDTLLKQHFVLCKTIQLAMFPPNFDLRQAGLGQHRISELADFINSSVIATKS